MAFFEDSYLITVGVQGENSVAIWNLRTKIVEKSALLGHYAVNQIRIDPNVTGSCIQFVTVGNNCAFTVWRYDTESQQVSLFDVGAPERLNGVNFLSVAFTDLLEKQPQNKYEDSILVNYAIVGTSEGQLIAFDLNENKYEGAETARKITNGQIGILQVQGKSVVFGSSDGIVAKYQIAGSAAVPSDMDVLTTQKVDSAVVSISMDDANEQGLVGTEAGSIFYLNFVESVNPIKLVSSNNMNQDAVNFLRFDFANPKVFFASCGPRTDQLKLCAGASCDQVVNF
jgi:WD40 repeat protein